MYKTKLRAWGIRKCNLEQTIEQGKDKGKPPKFSNKGSPSTKPGLIVIGGRRRKRWRNS
jgi:hypothetical protein